MKQLTPEQIEFLNTTHVGDYVCGVHNSAVSQIVDIIDDSARDSWSPFKVSLKKIARNNLKMFKKQKVNDAPWFPSLFHYRKLTPELLDAFRDARLEEIDRIEELRKLL